MKTIAFLVALAFAAPLAANAAPAVAHTTVTQTSVAQKVQQTYHTSFPGVSQNAGN